jgi:hypothetical protein
MAAVQAAPGWGPGCSLVRGTVASGDREYSVRFAPFGGSVAAEVTLARVGPATPKLFTDGNGS